MVKGREAADLFEAALMKVTGTKEADGSTGATICAKLLSSASSGIDEDHTEARIEKYEAATHSPSKSLAFSRAPFS